MTLVLPDREPNEWEIDLIKSTTKLREVEFQVAELHRKQEELKLAEVTYAVGFEKAANIRNRTFDFVAPVQEDTVEGALDIISRWHRLSHDPITVRFTSPGGNPVSGLVLIDALTAMKDEGTKVVTVALGMAASMAAVLLQAGSTGERVVGPTARIMVHKGSMQLQGKTRDVDEQKAFADSVLATLVDILAERANVTRAEIKRKIEKGDWWLDADTAIKVGFADRKGFH